jgi:hypothetical protein
MIEILALVDYWLFWAIFGPISLLFFCYRIENKGDATFPTILLLSFSILLQLATDIKPFTFIYNNPIDSLYYIFGYILLGILYVWIKWYSFVHTAVRKRDQYLLTNKKGGSIEGNSIAYFTGYKSFPIQVSDYKEMIFGWIFYWPISSLYTLLNDPIYRILNGIYNLIANSLQNISDNAFKDK